MQKHEEEIHQEATIHELQKQIQNISEQRQVLKSNLKKSKQEARNYQRSGNSI